MTRYIIIEVLGNIQTNKNDALGYADESPTQRPRKNIEDIVEYRL